MKYEVLYLPPAVEDLEQISDYIAYVLEEPRTAVEIVRGIREATGNLAEYPLRHRLCEDAKLASRGARRQYYKNYVIFYHVSEDIRQVEILTIRHMRVASQSVLYRLK